MQRTRWTLSERRPVPLTRPGLLPEATHLVLPSGITSTSFPATEETCRKIGIRFDPWQADLNQCILAKREDGLYAADTVVLSIPRQVGKTYDVGGVVFADSIINPRVTTVWTAHRFKVARESFNEMRAWARSPLLRQHIDYDEITTAAGNECIPFRNGSRVVFAARERGAVRGFTKVRRLVLDEGQVLSEMALADLVPTLNQAHNPQIILMGTPPKPTDPSEVWVRLREEALKGEAEGSLYVEFSGLPDRDPLDEESLRRANPSYPKRTPRAAILRMYKLLSPDDFRREALGIWDEKDSKTLAKLWARLVLDLPYPPDGPRRYFLDCSPGMASASIGVAVEIAGRPHLELADYRQRTGWLVDRAVELQDRHPGSLFGLFGHGAVAALVPDLDDAGVSYRSFTETDMATACGHLQKLVTEEGLTHSPDRLFASALDAAIARPAGGDQWTWARRKSGDISPIVAATGAAWLLEVEPAYDVLDSVH